MSRKRIDGDFSVRAAKFLEEISEDLAVYRLKWIKYFHLKDWNWDDDLLSETIYKCWDTISRLNLKDGKEESFNYLFKALNMNYKRELQYARNKNRTEVEDINVLYETYVNSNMESDEVKVIKDLWIEYQMNYLVKKIRLYFSKDAVKLFKLKYVKLYSDEDILKKSKNSIWKKDLKIIEKWLSENVDRDLIVREFKRDYPDLDVDLIGL